MQRLKNYRVVIHIKNHNLCIILSFLLVSQRRIKCVFYSGGRRPSPSEERPPPPLSPGRGQAIMFGFGTITARVSQPEKPPGSVYI